MESFEELSDITEEESSKQFQTSNSLPWKLKAKEIWAKKTQNYFTQTKKTENILIHVTFSIGLGSMWRFPFLCHRNGGGSFILIYFFMLLLFGIPLLYMEMIIGQRLRVDNIRVWKQLVPRLGGMAYASILVCILISLYNSIIISWNLSYLGNSFDQSLPWNYCPFVKNITVTDLSCLQTVPHQYFWYHTTLHASGHIEEGIETFVPNLLLGIFAAWVFLFLIMITGIKISMSMLIFSVFLPYILLLCFFIRGLFLEGAFASLRRMVTIEVSALASVDLWRQAGGHVLYSLGLGMGTIITFSSYNTGGDNCIKVASIVALVNLVTSMLTTSIIFLVLGFWATTSGHTCVEKSVSTLVMLTAKGVLPQDAEPPKNILPKPPLDYLDWINKLPQHLHYQVMHYSLPCSIKEQKEKFMEGPGLAYAAFSQAVSLFPRASFWAIVFFLALLITQLGTLIRILEGIVLPLQNNIPIFIKHPRLVPVVICLGGLLGSLIFTSHPGSYIMSLFDDHVVPLTLIVVVTFQNVALAWIYGARRFREEMFSELGRLLWPPFTFLLCYVTVPGLLALLTICLMQLYQRVTPYYIAWNSSASQEVKQPYLTSTLAWVTFLSIFTLLPIPAHPLLHWWYCQNPVISDTFKKASAVPAKPLEWPKHLLRKSNVSSQDKFSETSSRKTSLPWKRGSQSFSGFSLPLIASWFSMRSSSPGPSRQVSPVSTDLDNHNRETMEEKLPNKSVL